MIPRRYRTHLVHPGCDSVQGSSGQGDRTVVNVRWTSDAPSGLRGQGTNFVGKSVDGLGGWSRDFLIGGVNNFCASCSTTLFRPKRCKIYRVRVEVHQKRLESGTLLVEWNATEITGAHSRNERYVRDLDYLAFPNAFLVFLEDKLVLPSC